MECERFEEVSLLLDGELPEPGWARAQQHLAACPECGALAREERARRSVLAAAGEESDAALEGALAAVLRRGRSRFWHRRVHLPLPLAAGFLLLLVGALLWAGLRPAPRRDGPGSLPTTGIEGSTLDRYDRGGEPVLFTSPRKEG